MSYTPAFAPDARSQWRALDIPFQEAALDEVERLCTSPPEAPEHVSDVVIEHGDVRHFLFIHVTLDPARHVMTVVGVGYCTRARVP
jgi:hypothetical protein